MAVKNLSKEVASRSRSRDYAAFAGYLPNPDPVLKKQGRDISVYKELGSDAHIQSEILKRKSSLRALEYKLKGEDDTTVKFAEECIKNLPMYSIIGEITDAVLYGYKPLEIMWQKQKDSIVPKSLVGKPPEWFRFDNENNPLFLSKEAWEGEELPPYKFIIAANEPTYENPYGHACLSSCFWPVVFKRGGMKFWVTFTEKYGSPWVIGKYGRGTQQRDIDTLLENLENMVEDAVGVIPDESSVEIKEAAGKGASAEIYEKLLNFCNAEISKAIVGQTLTSQVGDKGSYAASKTHKQVLEDIITSDAKIVEEVFNTLIDWTLKINFSNPSPVTFEMYEQTSVNKQLSERDVDLSTMGVRFKKEYFLRNYGFKEDEIDISSARPSAAKAPASFAEGANEKKDDLLGKKIDEINSEDIADQIVGQLEQMLENADSYEEAFNAALEAYPKIDFSSMEEMLQDAIMKSMAAGGAEVEVEDEN